MSEIVQTEQKAKRSPTFGALALALAKAQGEMKGAQKDAANPFFKSKYADLASVIEAIKKPFADNKLAFFQLARTPENGVEIETFIVHGESGEYISESLFMPVAKWDAQGIGSAITYAKRYGLQAMAGVPSEDDDGNAAAAGMTKMKEIAMKTLTDASSQGTPALEAAWKKLDNESRKVCQNEMPILKAKAAKVSNANGPPREPGEEG